MTPSMHSVWNAVAAGCYHTGLPQWSVQAHHAIMACPIQLLMHVCRLSSTAEPMLIPNPTCSSSPTNACGGGEGASNACDRVH